MLLVGTLLAVAVNPLGAKDLTVISWGRVNQKEHAKTYLGPFEKSTGVKVSSYSWGGELNELIREMMGAGKTSWDVVEVGTAELLNGCKEGLYEKLDRTRFGNAKDLIPGAVSECGVGAYVWSTVIAWNPEKVKGELRSWAEFWDVKKHPGTRGLQRSAKYTLEIALLADGIAPADIYKVLETEEGVDRAFRKLDELKPYVKWWEAGAQAPLWLNSGQLDMTAAQSLWIDAAQNNRGWSFRMNWNDSLYDIESWAIVKGAPHPEEAYRFISFASKPENQKVFSDNIGYGPTNVKAVKLIGARRANQLPRWGANLKNGIAIDGSFWLAHGEELEKRFENWAPPVDRLPEDDHHH
jgi:putative spermidine/putrescine transport system substrate-binding protein